MGNIVVIKRIENENITIEDYSKVGAPDNLWVLTFSNAVLGFVAGLFFVSQTYHTQDLLSFMFFSTFGAVGSIAIHYSIGGSPAYRIRSSLGGIVIVKTDDFAKDQIAICKAALSLEAGIKEKLQRKHELQTIADKCK
jgi:hypothetical protein